MKYVKKFLLIIFIFVISYFMISGFLTVTKVCPDYINLMPRVVVSDLPNIKDSYDPSFLTLFCPLTPRVY